MENKIPDINNFAPKIALSNLSKMVPNITNFILKNICDTKIAEIESEYVSNTGFNSKLAQEIVITKKKGCKNYWAWK